MRYSHQRELIYNIIKGRKDHPTADMIYQTARELEPTISLGTVYRNLKLLSDENQIITLETTDKRIHYDGDTSNHSHFICSDCGKIIDLFFEFTPPVFLEEGGHKVTGEKRLYYGTCKDCVTKAL
ncbi:MAG: transcriptional repressor [Clostridiales bacterium]|nr:transcriptional repressor [Clostridiales bacterium]